jgi:predicted RNA binding protein YcfA (HicA-like mRNA interferase family)
MPPRHFDLDIRSIRPRLEREGWTLRKTTGDHHVYVHPEKPDFVPVPRGRGDLPFGTARNIARAAGWITLKDRQR